MRSRKEGGEGPGIEAYIEGQEPKKMTKIQQRRKQDDTMAGNDGEWERVDLTDLAISG